MVSDFMFVVLQISCVSFSMRCLLVSYVLVVTRVASKE
jgi:hypothetical protein